MVDYIFFINFFSGDLCVYIMMWPRSWAWKRRSWWPSMSLKFPRNFRSAFSVVRMNNWPKFRQKWSQEEAIVGLHDRWLGSCPPPGALSSRLSSPSVMMTLLILQIRGSAAVGPPGCCHLHEHGEWLHGMQSGGNDLTQRLGQSFWGIHALGPHSLDPLIH